MTSPTVDAQAVIQNLGEQVKDLSLQLAIARAQLAATEASQPE